VQEDSGHPEKRSKTTRNSLVLIGLSLFAGLILLALIGLFLVYSNFALGHTTTPEVESPGVSAAESQSLSPRSISPTKQEAAYPPATGGGATAQGVVRGEQEQPSLSQTGGRSAGDPYIPEIGNNGYDVLHYTLQLGLDPQSEYVEGTTTIEARSTFSGLAEFSLDFAGFQVSSVTVNGRESAHRLEDKKLIIELPNILEDGQIFSSTITYEGASRKMPSEYVGYVSHLGLHFPDGESIFTLTEPDGARYWYPANDHPRDKATFRMEVVVPAGLTAVSNGRLVETDTTALPDGRIGQLFVWEHDQPMAPYLAMLAVGDYETVEDQTPGGIELRHYVFPDQKEQFLEATADIGAALDWMSQILGPYPFDQFGYVTARSGGASMEAQTMVLLSENMVGSRTAVHELAHMWFGDWVSLDSWAEMWRNEGLATYFQMMWESGDDAGALEQHMERVAAAVEENNKEYPLDNPPAPYLFEFNVYQKGALAAHALRQEIGDEAFFSGLQHYFKRFGGGTASDDQFQEVMEEAAGRSLESFFRGWFGQSSVQSMLTKDRRG
jgi:aminopeptidase N